MELWEGPASLTFTVGSVQGNIRLIQDNPETCAALVDDRIENWKPNGYDNPSNMNITPSECSVGLTNSSRGIMSSTFYIKIDSCDCFAALHFS
ncbi:hypothetical protein KC217_19720, partial [Mycobacterium tuberculosis]|nr:hypothetical protein [Mycobacterium tuberculosis]